LIPSERYAKKRRERTRETRMYSEGGKEEEERVQGEGERG